MLPTVRARLPDSAFQWSGCPDGPTPVGPVGLRAWPVQPVLPAGQRVDGSPGNRHTPHVPHTVPGAHREHPGTRSAPAPLPEDTYTVPSRSTAIPSGRTPGMAETT
ncbi:hypothetical protein GCM10018966_094410 [Streptomyces yanii]